MITEKISEITTFTKDNIIVGLGGNPNVGKSTIFNNLTGLNQHTGNWPGKTVTNARGNYSYNNKNFNLVDLPGTYSLMANSIEEEIARDFLCFETPDATVIVVDATCLERNLNLVLQTLEITPNVVVCVNLMDEANRKGIFIDLEVLSEELGVPVVGTSAISGKGLKELMNKVDDICSNKTILIPIKITYKEPIEDAISSIEELLKPLLGNKLNPRWVALKLIDGEDNLLDSINQLLGFNLKEESNLMK